MDTKWYSRGGDPEIESFYTTEYTSRYRPFTTSTVRDRSVNYTKSFVTPGANQPSYKPALTGFANNNHVSPLELNSVADRDTWTSTSHAAHSQYSTIYTLMQPHETRRSTMERSGYWNEPSPGVLYQTPHQRAEEIKTRELTAQSISNHTLKQMSRKNAIDAENGGTGPNWGSTTYNQAYCKHESNHDRYWKTRKELIGKKEPNSFTRQHLTVSMNPIADNTSVYQVSYKAPPINKEPRIPNRTVVEPSGFARSEIPTITHKVMLADRSADQMHPTEVATLKRKNTPEYQNLFNPEPNMTTYQISYNPPPRERGFTAKTTRRGPTGYGRNETLTVGTPGDQRTFRTGITETMDKYTDPELGFRGWKPKTANVVERSGFWGN